MKKIFIHPVKINLHGIELIIAFLLFAQTAMAQETIIRLKPGENKRQLPVAGIEIVVDCADTTQLGVLNKQTPIVADKPLTQWLQQYVDSSCQYTPNGAHVKWIIKDLRMCYAISAGIFACLFVKAAVLQEIDGNYQQVASIDTLLHRSIKYTANPQAHNIEDAMDALLHASRNEVCTHYFNAPVYQVAHYRTGVYLSYQEFLENQPGITNFIIVKKGWRLHVYANNAPVENYWGLCTNDSLYKYAYHRLIHIKRAGRQFVLDGFMRATRQHSISHWLAFYTRPGSHILARIIDTDSGKLMF